MKWYIFTFLSWSGGISSNKGTRSSNPNFRIILASFFPSLSFRKLDNSWEILWTLSIKSTVYFTSLDSGSASPSEKKKGNLLNCSATLISLSRECAHRFFTFEIPSLFSQESFFNAFKVAGKFIYRIEGIYMKKRVPIPENWLGTPTCIRPPSQFTYRNVLWKHFVLLRLTCLFPGFKATVDFCHECVKTKFRRFTNWQIVIN